jgi:hypothetical protein
MYYLNRSVNKNFKPQALFFLVPLPLKRPVYNAFKIAVYAALGFQLESKSNGLLLARHESGSRTPQTVIPTHFSTAKQPLTTYDSTIISTHARSVIRENRLEKDLH